MKEAINLKKGKKYCNSNQNKTKKKRKREKERKSSSRIIAMPQVSSIPYQ